MRDNNDDRKDRLREGQGRVKASGLVSAVDRYRALAKIETCEEADQAQLTAVLTMREGWESIECRHCHTTPTIEELARVRPHCGRSDTLSRCKVGTSPACILSIAFFAIRHQISSALGSSPLLLVHLLSSWSGLHPPMTPAR